MKLPFFKGVLPPQLTGRMARDSGAGLAMRIFATACGFLFAVAAARVLGARGYGLVSVALSVANVGAIIALLGTNELAVREIAASGMRCDWNRIRQFVRWSSYTVGGSSILVVLVIAGIALVSGPYRTVLLLGSIGVPLLAGLHLLRGASQGAHRIIAAQLPSDVVRLVVALVLIGLLIVSSSGASPDQILLVVLFSFLVAFAVALTSFCRYTRAFPTALPSQPKHGRWLSASLPFLIVALLGIAATELNTLMLGLMSGPLDAGLYQPIARIAPLMLVAKEAIDTPLAPRIAGLWEAGEREQLRRLVHRSALASFVATAVVSASILLASPYIFAAFGSEFEPYSHYLYWIAAAHLANTLFGPSSHLLAMAGDMRRRMQAQALTLAVQAVPTTALVPSLGVAGAVVALSVQIVFWAGLNWMLAKRSTQIDTSVIAATRTWLKVAP